MLLQLPLDIRTHVDGFYKDLCSPSPRGGVALALDIWSGTQLVSNMDNKSLLTAFSEEEVLAAIKGMNPASGPGHDGLPLRFFQIF